MNPEVDNFLEKLTNWQQELTRLRELILDCGLTENFKWKHPCYTYKNKNILLIHGFKDYFALLFNKGALLKDSEKILIQQTENTQSARHIRFTNISEIEEIKTIIKEYIFEAIEVEKAGLKVKQKTTADYEVPKELTQIFNLAPDFEKTFYNLTPGRQRGYLLHFAQAKQSKTRTSRIEKFKPKIFNGHGFNDCDCGLSKRKPTCDGSHKQLTQKK